MPEEFKEKILKYLKFAPDEKFSVSQLYQLMGKETISYPTLLKWLMVLQAEGKISVEDYGSVKLVYLNKEYFKEGDKNGRG